MQPHSDVSKIHLFTFCRCFTKLHVRKLVSLSASYNTQTQILGFNSQSTGVTLHLMIFVHVQYFIFTHVYICVHSHQPVRQTGVNVVYFGECARDLLKLRAG